MNWRQNLRHRLSRHILTVTTRIGVLLLLTQAATAAPPAPGILNVRDDAKLFTAKGVAAAQSQFEKTTFPQSTHLTFATVQAIPAEKQAEFDKAVKNSLSRGQFFDAWARELAKKDQETGVFVLMFDDGKRFITRVVADRLSSGARGFTSADAQTLTQTLNAGSQAALNKPTEEAQSLRDEALLKAVDFVAQKLLAAPQSGKVAQSNKAQNAAEPGKAAQASPLMGWLCMGLVGLLGIWLVMGLIRAFSGGGGGMGGGMGGGGFLTSMLGGLFGAAAGMYLYDQFFGSGVSDASAASGDMGAGDTGAGDWGGGSTGGDAGGGDWGGDMGGGDFGGGEW